MFKILIPRTISGSGVEYLKQKGCEIIQKVPVSKHDPILSKCDAILTGPSRFQYDDEVLRSCKNCKIIANFSAGVEHIDLLSAKFLHIPYTEKNKHLIAKKELEQMKKSAILINVSRGGIINETDLIDALKKGIIHGAGLDVFEQEPVPADSELLTLTNLIVTPHCASNTEPSLHNMELYAAEDIWRVLHGEPPKFAATGF